MSEPSAANEAAPREYKSIQLVLDHLQMRKDGHEVQKFVLSTQTPLEAICALTAYYGEAQILATPAHLEMIQQMLQQQAPVLIYTTPENTQVLMDLDDWAALCDQFPTQYLVCDYLQKMVAARFADVINTQGGVPKLMLFAFNLEAMPVPEQAQPNTRAA